MSSNSEEQGESLGPPSTQADRPSRQTATRSTGGRIPAPGSLPSWAMEEVEVEDGDEGGEDDEGDESENQDYLSDDDMADFGPSGPFGGTMPDTRPRHAAPSWEAVVDATYKHGRGRRLGDFDPTHTSTSTSIDNSPEPRTTVSGPTEQEMRERRLLAAQAAMRRTARQVGSTPAITASTPPSRPNTTTPTPSPLNPGLTIAALDAHTTPTPTPLQAMMSERTARITAQRHHLKITERARKNTELAAKAARRDAALTPQERAEKKMKDEAMALFKKRQAENKAARERVKREIEENKLIRAERAEAFKAKVEAERVKKEREQRGRREAHERAKREMEEAMMGSGA